MSSQLAHLMKYVERMEVCYYHSETAGGTFIADLGNGIIVTFHRY